MSDRLESVVVDSLENTVESLEELSDELDHGPAGRAIAKLEITVGAFGILVALLLQGPFWWAIVILGTVVLAGGVYTHRDNDYREGTR
jgi:hypothetical protein